MIKYSEIEYAKVRHIFPNLYYVTEDNLIKGEMDIDAYYEKYKSGQWRIKPYSPGVSEKRICVVYDIEISLSCLEHGIPKVLETGGKIMQVGRDTDKPKQDMHLLPDNRCCLGRWGRIEHLTLFEFIKNRVYPFFVWQGYYDKYREIPPCGEHSHSAEAAQQELQKDMRALARNDICLCGSGKKYKKCCLLIPCKSRNNKKCGGTIRGC